MGTNAIRVLVAPDRRESHHECYNHNQKLATMQTNTQTFTNFS